MKFGGTSVADLERIRNVARHVKREVDAGNKVAVVVSAMAGQTDQLVAWVRKKPVTAGAGASFYDAREYDASGGHRRAGDEQACWPWCCNRMDIVDARSWLGWQIPIRTDAVPTGPPASWTSKPKR